MRDHAQYTDFKGVFNHRGHEAVTIWSLVFLSANLNECKLLFIIVLSLVTMQYEYE